MREPSLSTAPTLAQISLPRAQNHLPIGPPSTTSIERRHVTISAALPPSGAIDENPDTLLSLSLSYHDDRPSPEAAAPPHGRKSTMDLEPGVVP
jgi:hypothetical protein